MDADERPTRFFTVIYAIRFDEQINVTLEGGIRIEVVWDVRARELLEDFGAIRFKPRVMSHPERRRSSER